MRLVSKMFCWGALVSGVILLPTSTSFAVVTGPYTADANTLHLWNLDQDALNLTDAGSAPLPLMSLGDGNASQLNHPSYPGFGGAYQGVFGNTGIFPVYPVNGSDDNISMSSFMGSDGAFTYELILRVDFDPAAPSEEFFSLINADNDTSPSGSGNASLRERLFAWNLTKSGNGSGGADTFEMTFVRIGPDLPFTVALPTLVQDHWYHAAVTYNGNENTSDNLKLYWTDMGEGATQATQVGSGILPADMDGSKRSDFSIGAYNRNGTQGQWPGLIDNVRISDIARGADEFIFTVPEPSSFVLIGIGVAAIGAVRLRRKTA